MSTAQTHSAQNLTLADCLLQETGVDIRRCYQCGKCSAGCPMAAEMDYPSSVWMRMLQTGRPDLEKAVLKSQSIWLCLSCETCYVRCPMEIDIPRVADFLRATSKRRDLVHPEARNILRFHTAFLDSIRYTGRLYEMGMVVDYKVRSRKWWQDLLTAPGMFLRGKLNLLPHRVKHPKAMRKLFKRAAEDKEARI